MSKQLISGWGRYPTIESELITPGAPENITFSSIDTIARGMGRSYGDSALSSEIISTQQIEQLISFDEKRGMLHCSGGTTLDEILKVFVPKGWF